MMNRFRVSQALYTLLYHPEQLLPGTKADLQLALWSDNPYEQGQVAEILWTAIDRLLREQK